MKKLILFLALHASLPILIGITLHSIAQPCLPEGITFTTQTQIDSFQINYPNCTEIEGPVTIAGDDITNLSGLSVLTTIMGDLHIGYRIYGCLIIGNPVLVSLTGLNNMTSIGGDLLITGNDILTSLTGLQGLSSIGGYISIDHNNLLTNLMGLEGLTTINGSLEISNNYALTSLTGLENVTTIGGSLSFGYPHLFNCWGNPNLTSLTGLEGLTTINGNLEILGNDALTSLTGLDNVAFIGDDIRIWDNLALSSISGLNNVTAIGGDLSIGDYYFVGNPSLTSLAGLDNIDAASIENIEIFNNPSLSTCDVQSICDYLASPYGSVYILNNAVGCNNPPEIANGCGITLPCLPYGHYYFTHQSDIDNFQANYPGCTDLLGSVYISGDNITNLSGLNTVTSIDGDLSIRDNTVLTSLAGLEGLTMISGDLRIGYSSLGGGSANPALTSLSGLDNIVADSITDLYIQNNSVLSTCEVLSICDYLSTPTGVIRINDNATGCNSQAEVEAACETVTVEEINITENISIYPNPAKDILTISCTNRATVEKIVIYNQIGQKVLLEELLHNTIDVSGLSSGIYIVELINQEWKVKRKLIIR